MSQQPLGATVFWAAEGAGKSYCLSKVEKSKHVRLIYIDWRGFAGDDPLKRFYKALGMDSEEDLASLSTYLPNDSAIFTTIVFDHFDFPMQSAFAQARSMVCALVDDSVRCGFYNLLLVLNDPCNAQALLLSRRQFQREYVRLLGPSFCGRWYGCDLDNYDKKSISSADKEDIKPLVDQSGTLMPLIHLLNKNKPDPLFHLHIAQSERAWEDGERILACYRA